MSSRGVERAVARGLLGPCPCPSDAQVPTILVVPIDVHECWATDLHWKGDRRSAVGELVYAAKTYGTNKRGDASAADRLGRCLGWWAAHLVINGASQMDRADVVCPVPSNPSKDPYNLPDVLAAAVANSLGVPHEPHLVRKRRPTPQLKYLADAATNSRVLDDVFQVTADVAGKVVVVIDDIVRSGSTLEAVGTALTKAGADRIIALVATKAHKGLAAAQG